MLRIQKGLALLAVLAIGCDHDVAMHGVEAGQVGLGLMEVDRRNLGVVLVNRSSSNVTLSDLFEVGYVQSPLTYEVKGAVASKRSGSRAGASFPVLVNLNAHRVELAPSRIYGAVIAKEHLAAFLDLSLGNCYEIRAMYKPPDNSYTDGVIPSEFAHVCFEVSGSE